MADSRRETLLKTIAERLGAIKGGAGYTNASKLKSVQRYVHGWEQDEHLANLFRDTPTIIVRELNEESDSETVDLWDNKIDVAIQWMVIGQPANSSDLNSAIADMKKALFVNKDASFGVNATLARYSTRTVDPETGAPLDGVDMILSLTYQDTLGDPAAGG